MAATTDEPSAEVLDALLRSRGLDVSPELLAELRPAVRDLWEFGRWLEADLAMLSREDE